MANKDIPPKTKEETEAAIKALEEQIEKRMDKVEKLEAMVTDALNTEINTETNKEGGVEDKNENINNAEQNNIALEQSEKKVEDTRNAYVNEYLKSKKEAQKKILIEKTKNAISNVFKKAENKKEFKEEDYLSEEFKKSKKEYNEARTEMGNLMYFKKSQELDASGLTSEEKDKKLQEYKGGEILKKIILDEHQKVIDTKVEIDPKKKGVFKKAWEGYVQMSKWKKIALSTGIFFTAGAVGAGLSVTALAGVGGLATVRAARSIAMSALSGYSAKGIDRLKKSKDEEFKQNQQSKEEKLKDKFVKGGISLNQLEGFEKGKEDIEKENRKKARDRMLLKAGVSIAMGAGVGALSYELMGGSHETEHVGTGGKSVDTTHEGTTTKEENFWQKEFRQQEEMKGPKIFKTEEMKAEDILKAKAEASLSVGNIKLLDKEISITADHRQGAIENLREVQNSLKEQYGSDLANAPESVKHIINTDVTKLAQEYGLYNPNDINESAMIMKGDRFIVDKDGSLSLHHTNKLGQDEFTLLEKGTDSDVTVTYNGNMFDSGNTTVNKPNIFVEDNTMDTQGEVNDMNPPEESDSAPQINTYDDENPSEELVTPPLAEAPIVQTSIDKNINNNLATPKMNTGLRAGSANDIVYDRNGVLVQAGTIDPTRGIYNTGNSSIYQEPSRVVGNGQMSTPVEMSRPVGMTNRAIYEQQIFKGQNNTRVIEQNHTTTGQDSYEPGSYENAREVRRVLRGEDVVMDRPGIFNNEINGIRNKTWNEATDQMFKAKNIKFRTPEDYEREDTMQRLLGTAKQQVEYVPELNKNGEVLRMNYFREQPEWEAVKKIPAKYFFDTEGKSLKDVQLIDGTKLSNEEIAQIEKSDIFKKGSGEFKNVDELKRISKVYDKYTPKGDRYLNNALPIDDKESLQQYVQRMTTEVRTADKGTIYAVRDGARTPISVKPLTENTPDNSNTFNTPNSGSTTANTNIPTDDATYHKVFPDTEIVQGMTRGEFDNQVQNLLKSNGELSVDKATNKANMWLWEKFGKVEGSTIKSPTENLAFTSIVNKNSTAQDLMKSENIVGAELKDLRARVQNATGGTLINPTPDESVIQYVKRLMSKF